MPRKVALNAIGKTALNRQQGWLLHTLECLPQRALVIATAPLLA